MHNFLSTENYSSRLFAVRTGVHLFFSSMPEILLIERKADEFSVIQLEIVLIT